MCLRGRLFLWTTGIRYERHCWNFGWGRWSDFALTLISWWVFGAMLALLCDQLHPAALFAFLAPTLLGRQALKSSQMFIDTKQAYRSSQEALRQITQQIHEERSDERRLIAADLHDDVLQPLFKVTLTAQVLKAELSKGRLPRNRRGSSATCDRSGTCVEHTA
jgi:signal transduction histidine kinase